MADKYCKKSSLEAIADEVRTRAGLSSSNKLTTAQMKTTIDNLAIPVQRGSPSVALTVSSQSYAIQKGVYTSGTVSVTGQSKTATLSQNGSTVTPDSGKVLTSVTIPAKNVSTVVYNNITPSNGQSSITINNLSFSPRGYIITMAGASTPDSPLDKAPLRIASLMQIKDGGLYGRIINSSRDTSHRTGIPITSTTTEFGTNSLKIQGVVGQLGSTTYNGSFYGRQYTYIIWG